MRSYARVYYSFTLKQLNGFEFGMQIAGSLKIVTLPYCSGIEIKSQLLCEFREKKFGTGVF